MSEHIRLFKNIQQRLQINRIVFSDFFKIMNTLTMKNTGGTDVGPKLQKFLSMFGHISINVWLCYNLVHKQQIHQCAASDDDVCS